ncbi:MAG: hypothetical protein WCS42_19600 [Verrucomicrobiota bacterium]
MIGQRKFDHETQRVLQETKAKGVILIVAGGDCGDGCSVHSTNELARTVPALLRSLARLVEQEHAHERRAATGN